MARVPVFGRLYFREYVAVIFGFLFVALESLLHVVVLILPKPVIVWFHNHSRSIFHYFKGPPKPRDEAQRHANRIRRAADFGELCEIYGYTYEEHVVQTKDGYLLGLHRLPDKKGRTRSRIGISTGKVCYHQLFSCVYPST